MNTMEKNSQPSMEEILASIRRIIAEEPATSHASGELRGTPIMLRGDGVLDDAGDFDLPAIFRSSPSQPTERSSPLLGRLTDAIRSATSAQPEARPYLNGEAANPEPVEATGPESTGSYSGLSSLKPVRAEGRHGDFTQGGPLRSVNGFPSPELSSVAPQAQISGPGPTASNAPPTGEPKRVMAAFKDTHFLGMAGPAAGPSSSQPAALAGPPNAGFRQDSTSPVDFAAIIPGQIDRTSLHPTAPASNQMGNQTGAPPAIAANDTRETPIALPYAAAPPPPLPSGDPQEGEGTIEDTTADLLRPMLRQWLADNMPRMVEKALHIEIAESVKGPKKS